MRELAVIFDFGNVVGFFDYLKACERLGAGVGLRRRGFPLADCRARVRGAARPVRVRHDRTRAVRAGRSEPVGSESVVSRVCRGLARHLLVERTGRALIAHLDEAGYTLLLGSNTNVLHSTHYRRQFARTLDRFDHLVLSHEVGHMKPDALFYAACVAAGTGRPGSASSLTTYRKTWRGLNRRA